MTTYTYTPLVLVFDENDDATVSVNYDSEISITFPENITSLNYMYDYVFEEALFTTEGQQGLIDGVFFEDIGSNGVLADVVEVFWVDGGVTKTSYILSLNSDLAEVEYIIPLGGDPIPVFSSLAEFLAFEDSIIGFNSPPATGTGFGPGDAVPLPTASGLGVVVTEDDVILATDYGRDLSLGLGDDTFFGGGSDDSVSGGVGDDNLSGGLGNDVLEGDDDDDILNGDDGNDLLYGDQGADFLGGGAGDDYINGGLGKDEIFGGVGADSIIAGGFADTVYGGDDNDTISAGNGNDRVFGDDGDDVMTGNKGKDNLFGGQGADTIDGGNNNDYINGGNGKDVLIGGKGDDEIFGGGFADTIDGGADDDRLVAGNGNDLVFGGDGDDILVGNRGKDILVGGDGSDTMTGGNDADTFVFFATASGFDFGELGPDTGQDVITDWDSGVDMIAIAGIASSGVTIADDGNGNALVNYGSGSVVLTGVDFTTLSFADDFIFEIA